MAISSDLERLLARWLPRQRWMPALGGRAGEEPDITPLSVARIAEVSDDDAGTVQCLLVVLTVRGPRRHTRLCVPLSVRTVEDYALRSHLVGVVDDLLLGKSYVYDGAADPVFVLALADAIVDAHGTPDEQLQSFRAGDELPDADPAPVRGQGPEPGASLLARASAHRFRRTDGLGSESRVEIDGPAGVFALTILREIGAENPPAVRYPLALTAVESASVHPAVGWSQTRWFDDTDLTTIAAPFALLSHALPESRRAWRAAVETALRVDSGSVGSFNRQASALGTAVGGLHVDLGSEFGRVRSEGEPTRRLIRKWRERIDWAISRAPGALGSLEQQLREHADSLDGIHGLGPLQRVHGELTLDHISVGTAEGPRVISFAVTPDEPRPVEIDLVAMLRSMDYAAGYAWLQRTGSLAEGEPRIRALATRGLEDTELRDDYLAAPEHLWYRQTANSFLSGYAHALGETKSVTDPLLRAALIDRLLVEVVSEMRDRPAWLIVPLAALAAALGDGSDDAGRTSSEHGSESGHAETDSEAETSTGGPDEEDDVFARAVSAGTRDGGSAEDGSVIEVAAGADILPGRTAVEDDGVGRWGRRSTEPPAEESAEPESAESEPAAEAAAAEEPAAEEPAAEEPAAEIPAAEEPAADRPAAGDLTADDLTADESAGSEPVADEAPETPGATHPIEDAGAAAFGVPPKPDRLPPGMAHSGLVEDEDPDADESLDEDGAGEDERDSAVPPRSARDSRGVTD
ncbi:maltokinase N-terminal cap-like domain-containing protein [Brevibacterium jeotgali]|uniref:Maltokinase N-terminal cap domain-containing protein n=1 Tax=Brevibacterium jeotgali TaxID=1262550 RepID=A0A2H1L2T9_9MICO|nr:hypothetical protein [Brevibacterium jeotgali]TWC01926.1 hypothetical protein FB108_0584 [Brevibacterium jeotgali]SMY10723.1 hypothetical protein BJEO58_00298 [Brevibacterium jeotgali]